MRFSHACAFLAYLRSIYFYVIGISRASFGHLIFTSQLHITHLSPFFFFFFFFLISRTDP